MIQVNYFDKNLDSLCNTLFLCNNQPADLRYYLGLLKFDEVHVYPRFVTSCGSLDVL